MTQATEEDIRRSHAVWIWFKATSSGRGSFTPFSEATHKLEIIVPIGWRLEPHPTEGVILVNMFGRQCSATSAVQSYEQRFKMNGPAQEIR